MQSNETSDRSATVVQPATRFSEAVLWKLQSEYYVKRGSKAWLDTPSAATNTPSMARSYARLVVGFVEDLIAAGSFDKGAPLHIIELGAGSGRLAGYFAPRFERELGAAGLTDIPWRYILTDISRDSVADWATQPRLAHYAAHGCLQFALFDSLADAALITTGGAATLTREALVNPVVFVANYVFDTLPHDLFAVRQSQLLEGVVTTMSTAPAELSQEDPAFLNTCSIQCDYRAVATGHYYGDAARDNTLEVYRRELGSGFFYFPIGALRVLDNICELANGRLLLIAADKGVGSLQAWQGATDPNIATHGSFSVEVNFDAIARDVSARGGHPLQQTDRAMGLLNAAYAFGLADVPLVRTRRAFQTCFVELSAGDLVSFYKDVPDWQHVSPASLLTVLRAADWDPVLFGRMHRVLANALHDTATGAISHGTDLAFLLPDLRTAVQNVIDNALSAEEQQLACSQAALVLIQAQAFGDALLFLERDGPPEDPVALLHAGMCHLHSGDARTALQRLDAGVALMPDNELMRRWRDMVAAQQTEPAAEPSE